jgi:hypothetical protein
MKPAGGFVIIETTSSGTAGTGDRIMVMKLMLSLG